MGNVGTDIFGENVPHVLSFIIVNNHSVLQLGHKYYAHIVACHAIEFRSDGTRIELAC